MPSGHFGCVGAGGSTCIDGQLSLKFERLKVKILEADAS